VQRAFDDPNPHVLGGGAEALRRAGVEVCYADACAGDAATLIADWAQAITPRR
jgi:hypothetical protein